MVIWRWLLATLRAPSSLAESITRMVTNFVAPSPSRDDELGQLGGKVSHDSAEDKVVCGIFHDLVSTGGTIGCKGRRCRWSRCHHQIVMLLNDRSTACLRTEGRRAGDTGASVAMMPEEGGRCLGGIMPAPSVMPAIRYSTPGTMEG